MINILKVSQSDAMVAGASEEDVLVDHHAQDALLVNLLFLEGLECEHPGEIQDALCPRRQYYCLSAFLLTLLLQDL